MPLPNRLARFNRRVTNPIARTVAGRIPPLAIVAHRGRRSGTVYRTPVMAFRERGGDAFVVALTYGPDTDWVRNVLAAGGCDIVRGRKTIALAGPRLVEGADPPDDLLPPVRWGLRRGRVQAYLRLTQKEGNGV